MKHLKKLTIALLALLSFSATAWADSEPQKVTIKEFLAAEVSDDVKYELTGTVSNIQNTTYGNFDLTDNTGTVYVYGLLTPQGASKQFASMGIEEGTNITVIAPRSEFNGTPQAQNAILVSINPATGTVTISNDKTEASFEMPQNDVTVTYSLKRDMTVEMTTTVGDGTDGVRYRVQKQGNDFVPVGLTSAQVMALFNVHDQIENADLTAATDYTVQIFAADEQGQPTGTAMTFQNFTYAPGQYIVKAVATEGSNYVGETALSNVFTLFQGYEIEVAAGEYATYYKDEALYVEDEDAKLYTITAVSGDKATATELTVAAANTPILVKNNGSETKTILLIPTTTSDKVDVYPGFLGTLTATTIAASDATADRYALNGLQFVWVKNAIPVAANKAWLEIPAASASNAPRLTIVFDSEATGISTTNYTNFTNDEFYDLNGRKLNGKPTKKGVYIRNGKKVVVK